MAADPTLGSDRHLRTGTSRLENPKTYHQENAEVVRLAHGSND